MKCTNFIIRRENMEDQIVFNFKDIEPILLRRIFGEEIGKIKFDDRTGTGQLIISLSRDFI